MCDILAYYLSGANSANASGGCGYCGGVARGEDLRARYDRDRDPPAHVVGARYTHSSARASGPATKLHGLLDKG